MPFPDGFTIITINSNMSCECLFLIASLFLLLGTLLRIPCQNHFNIATTYAFFWNDLIITKANGVEKFTWPEIEMVCEGAVSVFRLFSCKISPDSMAKRPARPSSISGRVNSNRICFTNNMSSDIFPESL
jgi:hypothetical protein